MAMIPKHISDNGEETQGKTSCVAPPFEEILWALEYELLLCLCLHVHVVESGANTTAYLSGEQPAKDKVQ